MKFLFVSLSLLLATTSFAQASELVKTCDLVLKMPEGSPAIPTTYKIFKEGSELKAVATQVIEGKTYEMLSETTFVSEYDIRAGLTARTADMNPAEILIEGTQAFLETPGFSDSFSVGLDLKAVRHVKLFEIGRLTHMGGTAIVEAKDKDGKDLGSFLTGFLPYSCSR